MKTQEMYLVIGAIGVRIETEQMNSYVYTGTVAIVNLALNVLTYMRKLLFVSFKKTVTEKMCASFFMLIMHKIF